MTKNLCVCVFGSLFLCVNSCPLWPMSLGVQCQAVMARVMWQGSTHLTAAHPAARWPPNVRKTVMWTERLSPGSLARQTAWPAPPQGATARATSVAAFSPTGGTWACKRVWSKMNVCLNLQMHFPFFKVMKWFFSTSCHFKSVWLGQNTKGTCQTCGY